MRFTHTAHLPDAPEVVMARLLAGPSGATTWELSPDGRHVRVRTERRPNTGSKVITTDTEVTVEPAPEGTQLTMTTTLDVGSRGAILLRPWGARRVRATFDQLVRSLETGTPMPPDTNRRAGAILLVRIHIAFLTILLLLAAAFVAFFALISWPLAAAIAALYVLAATRPIRRIIATRRAIRQSSPTE